MTTRASSFWMSIRRLFGWITVIKLRVHNGGIVMVDAVLIINAYRVPDLPKSNPVIAVVSVFGWQISSLADLNYILGIYK